MAQDTSQRLTRLHELDLKHQKFLHKSQLLYREEDARRLKLRTLAARDENALVNDKLAQASLQNRQLARYCDQVRVDLEEAKELARRQQARIKKQVSELASLKTEIESLGGSMQDSGKVLQEKFALTRELDRLRPELEHLQSQLLNHQAVVAEKRNLQRQLDSLEVELENEKRSRQRVRDRDDKTVDDLKSRMEEAEKRTAADKRDHDKARKDHERQLSIAKGQTERLEERLSTMKEKLKEAETELKSTKAELGRYRLDMETAQATQPRPPRAKLAATKGKIPRKRAADESLLEDPSLGTPGVEPGLDKRPIKKRGVDLAAYGEKSTFSITPFLHRSKNLSDTSTDNARPSLPQARSVEVGEAAQDADLDHEEQVSSDGADEPGAMAPAPESKVRKAQKASSKSKLNSSNDSAPLVKKKPAPARKAGRATASKAFAMEAESQEEDNHFVPQPTGRPRKLGKLKPAEVLDAPSAGITADADASVGEAEARKKKRKVLGAPKSIFDDDDEEVASEAPRIQPLQKRKKTALGGLSNAFAGGSFSPLKRDRRGVGASFLA